MHEALPPRTVAGGVAVGPAWSADSMSDRLAGGRPESNVYTVLLLIATLLVAGATVFLAVKSQQLFGSWNPFTRA